MTKTANKARDPFRQPWRAPLTGIRYEPTDQTRFARNMKLLDNLTPHTSQDGHSGWPVSKVLHRGTDGTTLDVRCH